MKILKILSLITVAFFLNFSFVNADFSSWLTEKISGILEVREDEKITIWEFSEKIWEKSQELSEILKSDKVLAKVSSCDVLNELIKKNEKNYPVLYSRGIDDNAVEESVSIKSTAKLTSFNWWNQDYSKTNVQVEWVDEWDIVKNDWRFIYILSNNQKSVKIFDTEKSEKVAEIPFPDENFYSNEIYISWDLENRKLVLIWNWREEWKWNTKSKEALKIYTPGKNFVKIFTFDLKNLWTQEKFFPERKIFFEWNFWKSRLIWEKLFLITKKYSRDFWWWEKNEKNIWERNIPEFLDSSEFEKPKKIAKCWEIEFFPWSEKTDFVTVSAIDLSDKNSKIEKKIFLWDLDKIYMSKKNLYIAAWVRWEDWNFWNWDNTQIVKFWLENLELKNIWKVKWRILNQFSMDEFEWNFRIATTKNDSFERVENSKFDEIIETEWSNNLFILDENLKQIWEITWIAKWEEIKSVRFMWAKAFVVTFENIDPFFVLDLKDWKNPKILWELKIPGWSDYLHPFWENFVLWFWKDTKVPEWDENFSWKDVEWMKISLFDITDLKNPKEKFTWNTWERWTNSDVLNNHRALFFDEKDWDNAILWFHLNEKNTVEFEQKNCFEFNYSNCPNSCQKRCTQTWPDYVKWDCDWPWSCVYKRRYDWDNIRTTFAWAVFLDINLEKWFTEKLRISNFTKDELEKERYFREKQERKISRIVRIWENFYWISEDAVIKVWKNFSEQKNFILK